MLLLLEQARILTQHGFPVIPVKNKIPVLDKWTDRRKQLATDEELVMWFSNGKADSIAITINNTEFAIDTDGDCERLFLEKLLPQYSKQLKEKVVGTMHTKTPKGHHRTFRVNARDFPDGIPETLYLTLKGKHNEIALKGRKHYLVERGPGYEIVNGVECIFTLTKTEVQELLGALEVFKAEREAIIKVAKILRPYYTQPNRDNIIFSLSGYLHKGKTSELTITRIAEQLIDITGYADESPSKIYQTIKDTCAKDPDSQQVSGYKRFHEALTASSSADSQIDDVSNAIVEIEYTLKAIGAFTIPRKEHEQTQGESQQDHEALEMEELAKTKLTNEDIEFVHNTMIKEAQHDGSAIKQIFYGEMSAFTKLPIPHVVNSRDPGAGKSYLLNLTVSYIPSKYVTKLVGTTEKALFHRDGIMVIVDKDTGGTKPLLPALSSLKKRIEDLEEQNAEQNEIKKDKDKERKKLFDKNLVKSNNEKISQLKLEIDELENSAQKLIDLTNQITVFQDTPHPNIISILMSLLSQDSPEDQLYTFAEKNSSGKIIERKNRLRGMPVILTTQVIDDTDNLRFEEKNRRFINVTPSTSKEKIQTAMEQICKRYGLTDEEYDYDVVNKRDKERAKMIVNVMIAKLIQHSKHFSPRKTGVKIPFENAIAYSFPVRNNKVWLMTAVDRVIKYLAIITKINMDQRPKLINKATGKFYPISTFQDVADVLPLVRLATSNLRPYQAEFYDDVFLTAYEEQQNTTKSKENDIGILMTETIVGVTNKDLAVKYAQVYDCAEPSIDDIRNKHTEPLVRMGAINKHESRINRNENLYSPVEDKSKKKNLGIDKFEVAKPSVFPTKELLEESLRNILGNHGEGGEGENEKNNWSFLDHEDIEISIEELVERYYSEPERYFVNKVPMTADQQST